MKGTKTHLVGIIGYLPDSIMDKIPTWFWEAWLKFRVTKCHLFHKEWLEWNDVSLESECSVCGFVHYRQDYYTGDLVDTKGRIVK